MAAERNLALQLIISAKDQASSVLSKLFGFLDSEVSVVAGKIRDAFSGLFGGGLDGAIEFEAQLDRVQAKGGYTAEAMEQLKKAAIEIGAQFGLSGTQAAQGMESLAAAGLTATQTMQALPSVLALAKAEALSMDDASALLANSLTTVGLGFDQAARLADVLTQAANESTTSATAVGKALETAGGIARTAGLDLEQAVAVLTALAKSGIEGERAGTALAAILTQLLNPASKASEELNALGITSRDLGTVIGELQSKGVNANAAILAFGETAGPGLRALISQGPQGIADLEQALLGADGAAQKAAEGIGGNLKGAMEALGSAWENVKSALFEPVLESLTQAARDASEALNGSLNDSALKPAQEAIKAFVEQGISAARDFVANFDFRAAVEAIQQFARDAAESFASIKNAGQTAADTVKIAWNAVTAGFKTIGAGLTEIAASVVATLANIEQAASTVGLGSVERANALRATALEMQTTAAGLIEQAATDAREMGEAYDRLTGNTDAAAAAQRRLKDSLPVAELQTITKTLADYQGIAQRANDEAERARISYDAGTVSAKQYGQALLAAAQANAELAAATKAQAAGAKDAVDQSNRLTNELKSQVDTLRLKAETEVAAVGAQRGLISAQEALLQASIDLAQAQGREADVKRLLIQLAQNEANQAAANAVAKNIEAKAAYQVLALLEKEVGKRLEAGQAIDDATKARLESAQIAAQTAEIEAQAAGQVAEVQQQQVIDLQALTKEKQNAADASSIHAAGMHGEASAARGASSVFNEWKDNLKIFGDTAADAAERLSRMNDAVEKAAQQRKDELKAQGEFVSSLVNTWTQRLGDLSEASEETFRRVALDADTTRKSIAGATDATELMRDATQSLAAGGIIRWANELAIEALKIELSFTGQAKAADNLANSLEKMAEKGGVTAGAIEQMVRQAEAAKTSFTLLDQERLDHLQSAIDAANDKLREMQEETQSAKDRLQELNADLAEARGEDKKAQELRQQLEFQTDLAAIEDQRRKAELTGNTELLRTLDEQKKALEALNKIRIDNIRSPDIAEKQRRYYEDAPSAPERTGGGLATNTFNINVDGRDLLSEEQIRNKIIPVINRTLRLKS